MARRGQTTGSSRTSRRRRTPEETYWVAHVKGAEFGELERLGFLTLYPVVDDYVFLRAIDANAPLVLKEVELGLEFLRQERVLQKVRESEIREMSGPTRGPLQRHDRVHIVRGHCEGMVALVLRVRDDYVDLQVQGFRTTYKMTIPRGDVVSESDLPS